MKYINSPLCYKFIKNKFIENDIPYDKKSLSYFSNKNLLVIDKQISQKFESSSENIVDMIYELLEDLKKGDFWEYYDFNESLKQIIYKSLNKEELGLRLDWGMEGSIPKLFEINAESCGFITECSLIPRWLNEISNSHAIDLNLYENYTKKMIKNLEIKNSEKLFLGSLDYIYDMQNLSWIKTFLPEYNTHIINLHNLEETKNYYYIEKQKINNLHKIYPWEWIIQDENLKMMNNLKTTEPIWTILFNSKIILYLLWKKFKNHSNLLETYYDENIQGNFLEKKFDSMQGSTVIKSKGLKIWNDSILQKKINPIKIKKDILIFSTWIIDKKFTGIGVKADSKLISTATHKFIPLSIEY